MKCENCIGQGEAIILFGVQVFYGEKNAVFCPVGDRDGNERPAIMMKSGSEISEVFEAVWKLRGRYDFDREVEGFKPFDWSHPESVLVHP